MYLLKSVIWLSVFALVFILFLRNERFFRWNRIFLLAGVVAAFVLPFVTIRYEVPVPAVAGTADLMAGGHQGIEPAGEAGRQVPALLILYLSGTFTVLAASLWQNRRIIRSIRSADIHKTAHAVKIVRSHEYTGAFSFFSFVFVNPSITSSETEEILHHEMVHIRQRHWIDLALAASLCLVQWFNPFAWLYLKFIRQNHEYLADAEALQRSSDPARYMATLMNQIVGAQVFDLANSFSYSLNKKRFNMMKNIVTSPYRKLRMLLILPVSALLLWSYAEPEYIVPQSGVDVNARVNDSNLQDRDVNGTVAIKGGTPLPGAIVLIKGTTIGTSCDQQGSFKLGGVPADGILVVTHVGYKTKTVKASFTGSMAITLDPDTVKLKTIGVPPPPPPPPPGSTSEPITVTGYATPKSAQAGGEAKNSGVDMPPPPPPLPPSEILIKSADGKKPLIIVDGKETDIDIEDIDPSTIESVSVWKDWTAKSRYGDKSRDGVIEIKTKKPGTGDEHPVTAIIERADNQGKEPMVAVEEMPSFPGGMEAMQKWVYGNIKIQKGMDFKTVTEPIYVFFIVGKDGKVGNVKIRKSVSPLFDAEAVRVVSSLPDFKPGMQNGKPVEVRMQLPIDFNMKVVKKER